MCIARPEQPGQPEEPDMLNPSHVRHMSTDALTRLDDLEPVPAAPLDALFDAAPGLAGKAAAVATGRTRQVLITGAEVDLYRQHVAPGTTGTRLWTDPQVGTYIVLDD